MTRGHLLANEYPPLCPTCRTLEQPHYGEAHSPRMPSVYNETLITQKLPNLRYHCKLQSLPININDLMNYMLS